MNHRALILIPERDRQEQQRELLPILSTMLSNRNIPATIIVVHQNNLCLFNKGALLNIGYRYAVEKSVNFDYIILHDIDMIPIEFDYRYTDGYCHLNGTIENYGPGGSTYSTHHPNHFEGGVVIIERHKFELIGGFSNKYEGWGYEDRCLQERVKTHRVKEYIRTGRFRSWPNGRFDDVNPMYRKNVDMFQKIKPTDRHNQIEYRILEQLVDEIGVEHLYVDFKSEYPNRIDLNKRNKELIMKKIENDEIVTVLITGDHDQLDKLSQFPTGRFMIYCGDRFDVDLVAGPTNTKIYSAISIDSL
jgi:hypothetical protein